MENQGETPFTQEHPYVSKDVLQNFSEKLASVVGKIDTLSGQKMVLIDSKGNKIPIEGVKGGPADSVTVGDFVEIRGIVNKDGASLSFGELTKFDNEFDLEMWDKMMGFYNKTGEGVVY